MIVLVFVGDRHSLATNDVGVACVLNVRRARSVNCSQQFSKTFFAGGRHRLVGFGLSHVVPACRRENRPPREQQYAHEPETACRETTSVRSRKLNEHDYEVLF